MTRPTKMRFAHKNAKIAKGQIGCSFPVRPMQWTSNIHVVIPLSETRNTLLVSIIQFKAHYKFKKTCTSSTLKLRIFYRGVLESCGTGAWPFAQASGYGKAHLKSRTKPHDLKYRTGRVVTGIVLCCLEYRKVRMEEPLQGASVLHKWRRVDFLS